MENENTVFIELSKNIAETEKELAKYGPTKEDKERDCKAYLKRRATLLKTFDEATVTAMGLPPVVGDGMGNPNGKPPKV